MKTGAILVVALMLAGCGERQLFGNGDGLNLPIDAAGCVTERIAATERVRDLLGRRSEENLWFASSKTSIEAAYKQCLRRVSASEVQVIQAENLITEDSPGVLARVRPARRRCDNVFVGGSGYCFD